MTHFPSESQMFPSHAEYTHLCPPSLPFLPRCVHSPHLSHHNMWQRKHSESIHLPSSRALFYNIHPLMQTFHNFYPVNWCGLLIHLLMIWVKVWGCEAKHSLNEEYYDDDLSVWLNCFGPWFFVLSKDMSLWVT